MKYILRIVPTLILILFLYALCAHGQQPQPLAQESPREQKIQALRQELPSRPQPIQPQRQRAS